MELRRASTFLNTGAVAAGGTFGGVGWLLGDVAHDLFRPDAIDSVPIEEIAGALMLGLPAAFIGGIIAAIMYRPSD